jgi:cob(I)alamin adenosyltransferase
MGKRLSKIVTRTGDDGQTGMADGARLDKFSDRVEAIGAVDELNSFVGFFLAAMPREVLLWPLFRAIQNDLFDLGGELAMPGVEVITPAHWERLEEAVEQFNENLEPLTNFILPGGSEVVSRCHLVRAVTRRAERRYAQLAANEPVNLESRIYLNRLSDLCFVAGRWLADANDEPEVLWQQNKPASK